MPSSSRVPWRNGRKKQSKLEKAEARAKHRKVVNNLIARLSKFAGPSKSPNMIRFSSSGAPHGLLLGTPTFSSISSECKETKKLLSALEGGSSSAMKSFREVQMKVCYSPPSPLLLPLAFVSPPGSDLAKNSEN